MKIDIQTNINEYELTVESYNTVREEMYKQFLSFRQLKHALIAVIISLICYFLSDEFFFVYITPVILILFMLSSVLIAEYLTSKTRKVILHELNRFKIKKELLAQKKDI